MQLETKDNVHLRNRYNNAGPLMPRDIVAIAFVAGRVHRRRYGGLAGWI